MMIGRFFLRFLGVLFLPLLNVLAQQPSAQPSAPRALRFAGASSPEVRVTSPISGSVYRAPTSIDISVFAADPDGSVTSVEIFDGSTRVAILNASPFSFSWKAPPEGVHSISAKVVDNSGLSTTSAGVIIAVVPVVLTQTSSKYNPYNTEASLQGRKDWYKDPTPVTISEVSGEIKSYTVIPTAQRHYLDFALRKPYPENFLPITQLPNETGGCWDDVYASLDNGHSGIIDWSSTDGRFHSSLYRTQLITIGTGGVWDEIFPTHGINFTSQSYGHFGHERSNNPDWISFWEQSSYFNNTLRSSPAYFSYLDTLPEKVIDSYDGIYSHVINSLGQSNSEINGIAKMATSSCALPRVTKSALKATGNFASAMMYIYKSTLPYVASSGAPLPYENELFHRVAYLTAGNSPHELFFPYNKAYHQYNDALHLYAMTELAHSMTIPPPIVVMKLTSRWVKNGGVVTLSESASESSTDGRVYIQVATPTQFRVWGLKKTDEVYLRVDLTRSYDLQDRPLTFKLGLLYPEQKEVQITEESPGKYLLVARYDPKMPRVRIPVIVTAHNGTHSSNPAFINFYWPDADQKPIPPYFEPTNPYHGPYEMNRNKRPLISLAPVQTQYRAHAGVAMKVTLTCTDPEGFPVRWYRWAKEDGVLSGNLFEFTPTVAMKGTTQLFHFICSDGTGGYSSIELPVIVESV